MTNTELRASINQVISFMEIENILDQVRKTSSTNMKMDILNNNKDNELLAKVLEYTYNPHKRYGISERMVLMTSCEGIVKEIDVFKMLDKLANNNINDDLRMEFADFLEYYDAIAVLLRQIVSKDLKLGCNVNTINKIWDGLIPTSETEYTAKPMLASKYDYLKPPQKRGALTEKLDGIRCWALVTQSDATLLTRQGKLIEGCIEIENDLKDIAFQGNVDFMLLDGEITAIGCDYDTVYKETTKRVKNKNKVKTGIQFEVFDILNKEEYDNLKGILPYKDRREQLDKLNDYILDMDYPSIKVVPVILETDPSNQEEILNVLEIYRNRGAEGLMWNDLDAVYEFKRSKSILKLKVMQTVDLKIVGFEEGQGRNAGKLGALLVEYKDCIVGVGSGFSDHEREFIWKNQSMYLDKICEIQYFEETKNKDGGVSLRFPVWKHLRLDKDEPSLF